MDDNKHPGILVVGGGISGLTSAVEIAEVGYPVYLIEKAPYLGGRVIQNNRYFPKLCPPYCGLEINFKRIKRNPRIEHFTLSRVVKIKGKPGDFTVQIETTPRLVNNACTACGRCVEVCPIDRPNPFNYGLDTTKAIYLPHDMAFPIRYVIDPEACLGQECGKCIQACPYDAVDLNMQTETSELKVAAVIWATGWQPFDATQISYYGLGRYPNVITNTMMERLAAVNGPTGGRIQRPSDGKPVRNVAFVQCAGSRDEHYLPFCSGVCCLASLKQATYVREQLPDAQIFIYYIDIRAPGRLEDFFSQIQGDEKITLVKGKVADIREDFGTGELLLTVEDVGRGRGTEARVDLVVLATGMVPSTAADRIPFETGYDAYGFVLESDPPPAIIPVGCVKKPVDVSRSVQDATGAALKAIQSMARR